MTSNIQHKAGLFIGIGGSGVKSLARLKANMYQLYKNANEIAKFDEHYFIFIDTDANDIQKINDNKILKDKLDGKSPIDVTQFVNIGRTVPQSVRNNFIRTTRTKEETEHFFSWMISEEDNPQFRLIEQSLSNGAGASRIDGRTGFYDNFTDIKTKISDSLTELASISGVDWKNPNPKTGAKDTNFWVISGTNGGTGSSMTLDILFLIERLFRDKHNGKPSVKLALLTPEPYLKISKEIDNIRLNSFAFLWEINEFKTNPSLRFKDPKTNKDTNHFNFLFATNDFRDGGKYTEMTEPWDLFDYCLAFDTQTKNRDKEIGVDETFENVASTISTLACLNAGGAVNSNIINFIINLKTKVPNSVKTNEPKLIRGIDWGMFIAASGNKVIQKPLSEFTNYMRSRLKFEILKFGLIGESFEDTYGKNIENQNNEIKKISSEYLLKDLLLKSTSNSELSIDNNNIYTIINKEFSKITNPDYLDIKEKSILGVPTGFKDGVFLENWDLIKLELNSKIKTIKDIYQSDSNDSLSRSQILNRINNYSREYIDDFVIKKGYKYVYDVIKKIDVDLENKEGSKYLGDYNLINITEKINNDFSDIKLMSLESSIQACIDENKDLESFKSNLHSYILFQKERLILQIKKEIIEVLVKGKVGLFDYFLTSKNGESGLNNIIGKLEDELRSVEFYLEKLAIEFDSYNDPLKPYLPPLSEMVDGIWKQDSVFDKTFKLVIPRDTNGKSSSSFGINPLKNGDNSISYYLEKFRSWIVNKNSTDLIDSNYFAEIALNQNINFNDFMKSLFNYEINNLGFFEKEIVQDHPEVKTWREASLRKDFENIESNNPDAIIELKNLFDESHVLYPTSRKSGLNTTCILSGGKDLKYVAQQLGFIESDSNQWLETTDNSFLSKIVFEVGHTLGEYHYLSTYAEFYEKNRNRILGFEKGCHIHKHFNQLNIDKSMLAVYPGFPVVLKDEIYSFNLAIYSSFFQSLKVEKPDLYNLFFAENDPMLIALGIDAPDPLPLIYINENSKGTLVLKNINFNSTTKKIESAKETQISISGASGFGDFLLKTIDENNKFKLIIETLSICFEANRNVIGGEFRTFLKYKFDMNRQIFVEALDIMKQKNWNADLNGKSILIDLASKVTSFINKSEDNIFQ